MGLRLFTFAYNTLLSKANDPNNQTFFLPKVLSGMKDGSGQNYLPLKEDTWAIDAIDGVQALSADFATTWFEPYFRRLWVLKSSQPHPPAVTQKMIDDAKEVVQEITHNRLTVVACPGSKPSLTVKKVEINGLQNLRVYGTAPQVTKTNEGYNFTITLDTNAYNSQTNIPENERQPLSIGGNYSDPNASFAGFGFEFSQCLCFVKNSARSQCVPLPQGVEEPPSDCNPDGFSNATAGSAMLGVENANVVAEATMTIAPDNRSLQVTVNRLTLQPKQSLAIKYTVNKLVLDLTQKTEIYRKVWTTFFTNLVGTSEVATILNQKINDSLNTQANLDQISSTLTTQMANALNDLLGQSSAPFTPNPQSDTNAVDQFVFHRLKVALNAANSEFYLPKRLLSSTSPQLEPYTTTTISISGDYKKAILGGLINLTLSHIQLPGGLTITGASNIQGLPQNIDFNENSVDSTLEVARLNPGPTIDGKKVPDPPLTATSKFSLMLQVNSNSPLPITGNLNITTQPRGQSVSPAIVSSLSSTGTNPSNLQLSFSSIRLDVNADDVTIQVHLDGADGEAYSEAISAIANSTDIKNQVVSALNGELRGQLGEISQEATTFAKQQLNNL